MRLLPEDAKAFAKNIRARRPKNIEPGDDMVLLQAAGPEIEKILKSIDKDKDAPFSHDGKQNYDFSPTEAWKAMRACGFKAKKPPTDSSVEAFNQWCAHRAPENKNTDQDWKRSNLQINRKHFSEVLSGFLNSNNKTAEDLAKEIFEKAQLPAAEMTEKTVLTAVTNATTNTSKVSERMLEAIANYCNITLRYQSAQGREPG